MKTILKRFVAVVVVITICLGVAGMFADVVRAKDEVEEEKIYTVVMVDLGGYTLYNDSGNGYRYDCQVDEMIQATTKYIEEVKNSGREEYIAVVVYTALTEVVVNFSNNYDNIISILKEIEYGDTHSGINTAFLEAEKLLDSVDTECKKNIINITKGINCGGMYSYRGKYSSNATSWYEYRSYFDIKYLEDYANCTYATFERLKEKYDIYTVLMVQKYNENVKE